MSRIAPRPIVVNALGATIALRCESWPVAEAVERAWQGARTLIYHGEPQSSITVGHAPSNDVASRDMAELLHILSPAVTQSAISANRGRLVMLHAAALANPATGATAVLVAPSGTGKTTASRTLGAKFAYLSDETAGITREGVVLPYRKPLSIVQDGEAYKSQHSPTDLGLLPVARECHVAALLVIERVPDHPFQPKVESLDTLEAIGLIAPQASYLPSLEGPLHRLVEVIKYAAGAHHVTYSEAGSLECVLEDLLGAAE